MTSENLAKAERRSESHQLLQDLVRSRTEMLTMYTELANRRPLKAYEAAPQLLQDFCQALVDYTATAHFRLYRYLDERRERRRAVLDVAEAVYPKILETTQRIVDFNDKYDGEAVTLIRDCVESDLSMLGECLADRIELEDQLIAVLTRPRG